MSAPCPPSCLASAACTHSHDHSRLHVGFGGGMPAGSSPDVDTAPPLTARGRGILKTERRPSKFAGLQWDERVIADHDLERGTRQKIEEPKTPFHRPRGLEDDMVDGEEAEEKKEPSAAASTPPPEGGACAFPPAPPPRPPAPPSQPIATHVAIRFLALVWPLPRPPSRFLAFQPH